MARPKFNLALEDFDSEEATQPKENATEEKATAMEAPVASANTETRVEEPQKEPQEEVSKESEPVKEPAVPAENKMVRPSATAVEIPAELLEEPEEDVFAIKVTQAKKKETLSKNKLIKLKPSDEERINKVLQEQYDGMSFNSLVNQLLIGWLEKAESVSEKNNKK